jgi:hypothetical protein
MNIKLFIMLFFIMIPCAMAQYGFGKLAQIRVGTYAIDDYPPDQKRDRIWAKQTVNYFCQSLQSRLSTHSPNTAYSRTLSRVDGGVTFSNCVHDNTDACEFLIYSTYGNPAELTVYSDNGVESWPASIGYEPDGGGRRCFGGNTKLVFFDACRVLWWDNSTKAQSYLSASLRGAHAYLGFASITYEFKATWRCGLFGLKTCSKQSWTLYDGFFDRWLPNNGETIWDAWKNAVWDHIYLAKDRVSDITGVEPAIVGKSTSNLEGVAYDATRAKYASMYRGPMLVGNFTGTKIKYGTPKY